MVSSNVTWKEFKWRMAFLPGIQVVSSFDGSSGFLSWFCFLLTRNCRVLNLELIKETTDIYHKKKKDVMDRVNCIIVIHGRTRGVRRKWMSSEGVTGLSEKVRCALQDNESHQMPMTDMFDSAKSHH